MNFDKAVSIIKEVSGTQLTEDVVDAFLRLVEKGKFRAPDDTGGGTTEDIDNIRKKEESDKQKKADASEPQEGEGSSDSQEAPAPERSEDSEKPQEKQDNE